LDRPGSKIHKKEIVESVTVLEAPPLIVVGVCGYIRTPRGLRCLSTVWAQFLSDEFKRVCYKNWYKSKKKAFTKYSAKLKETTKWYDKSIANIRKYSSVVRVIAHTQVNLCRIGQRKAHVLEIQVNGGTIDQKVDFALKLFEQKVPVSEVFKSSEMVDVVGVTRGHGFEGVTHRWGVTRLPRKTHKGLRKVACIGAWHPSRVGFTVPRAGQDGFHHRHEKNKKIYKIGTNMTADKGNARCETDLTDKVITPMGGFPHYGVVREDFILMKGTVMGPIKRPITLRKQLRVNPSRAAIEEVTLKFIDTSSKFGHGKFQTASERDKFMGPRKKQALAAPATNA
jgi:large subunit ribosomal protein L3e